LRIDEAQVVTLRGNVHPQARAEFDLGAADAETRLDRMLLLLRPSAAQHATLNALLEAQRDPRSPLFHRWLSPAEYGTQFGAREQDLARVTEWLGAHGFTVEEIPAGRRLIVFSGTAGQVEETFHTAIHRYRVNGVEHLANAQDPQVPTALAGVVGGIVSLHDFRRTAQIASRRALGAQPEWNLNGTHYLFPADFAVLYDLNPLYAAGTSGAGVSIAVAGRSNIEVSDVAAFRAASGLSANHPTVILAGADPGLDGGDQDEATLDVEWAGAVAPQAQVALVASASTASTDGVDLAAASIVNRALAQVVSVSYGSCERSMGAAELAFYNSLWQQAASQGMTALVASGDSGAAGCDLGSASSGTGAGVNGLCSSPYSTCVGGTEFDEGSNGGQYWAQTNSPAQGSALGYIPETVWNESASNGGYGLWASGGGVSTVYTQPAWQKEVSGASAANGMRAVPDVAMTAAAHDGYVIYENGTYWIVSGTSAAAPSLAGVMALAVESLGGAGQGNANPKLYALADAAESPFHATQTGNNSVPGVAGFPASGADYNLATGLGSVDGAALVSSWVKSLAPTLGLMALSSSLSVSLGGSSVLAITATVGGSFSGPVTLGLTGLPPGVSAVWSANPLTPVAGAAQSTLTLTAAPSAQAGAFPAVITATGDGLTVSQQLRVQVQPGLIRFRPAPIHFPKPRVPVRRYSLEGW
jgi:subtilase family serine protease